MSIELNRAAFEEFAQSNEFGAYRIDRKGDGYDSSHTQLMWMSWCAAIQQAEAQQPATGGPVVDVRCEGCGYMTHHREHMGCVRAAKQHTPPGPSVPDEKPLPDLMMASYHEAIGWNACRAAMLAAKKASA